MMNKKLGHMARLGYVAKGVVYGLTGILTFLAAFNLGGEKADQLQILDFLNRQTFGNILLIILGLGLLCYSSWRFTQSIQDPEGAGNNKKAIVKRIAFFVSGCLYMGLAVLAFWRVIAAGNSPDNQNGSGDANALLNTNTGLIILGLGGVIIIFTGLYQFIRVYKKSFLDKFNLSAIQDPKQKMTIKHTAYMGMASRGIIFLIMGFFAIKAALDANPSNIKTTRDAFDFISNSTYGAWMLAIIATGLTGYAIYMFMMAKYRHFKT